MNVEPKYYDYLTSIRYSLNAFVRLILPKAEMKGSG